MPTYVYRRKDGTTFEIDQRITEDALDTCPTTGQPITRVITGGTGLIFKGSGFYLTDYVRNGKTSNGEAKPTTSSESTSTSTEKTAKETTTKTSSNDD